MHVIILSTWSVPGVTVTDIDISQDINIKKSSCPLVFAEDNAFDATELQIGHGAFPLFPDSQTTMRLFRISHTNSMNPYEIQIIGADLQCNVRLINVFLQENYEVKATNPHPFKGCVRERIVTKSTMYCTFQCSPTLKSNATFVKFTRVNYNTVGYDRLMLKAILIHDTY